MAPASTCPVDRIRDAYLAENERLGREGLRVMATAQRDFDPATFDPTADLLPLVSDLTLLALVGIVDPPRTEAKAAIATAHAAGIQVRMITGDHAVTAEAIARQLGITGRAITGAEFAAMSDEEVDREIDDIGVIARVAPEDKVHLVDVLKRKGHVVAMTGDGVNDAPALKRADIGVAMGITGTEVSKEAAVMILTDDNFATIVKAVELGRALYDNLLRYIRYQMGGLFGFIVTFLGASLFFIAEGIPFTPAPDPLGQLHGDRLPGHRPRLRQGARGPHGRSAARSPEQPILPGRLFTYLVFIGLVMAVCTLGTIWWATDAARRGRGAHDGPDGLLAGQHLVRPRDLGPAALRLRAWTCATTRPCSRASGLAILATIAAVELGVLNRLLDTVGLTIEQWIICIVVSLAILVVGEVVKLLHVSTAGDDGGQARGGRSA